MNKTILSAIFVILFVFQFIPAQAQNRSIIFDLKDNRKIITRKISKNLLLRVHKDRSVTQKDFGWLVEVVRLPASPNSRNLIYTNKLGVGADASQIMAWQVSEPDPNFPAERNFTVRGTRTKIKIVLLNAQAEGKNSDAKFVAGKLKISWSQ